MKVIKIEPTPNPNAIKLNLDGRIIESGSRSFDTPGDAEGHALAKALFQLPAIKSVFFMPTFVTVSKEAGADWSTLAGQVVDLIEANTEPATESTRQAAKAQAASENALMRKIEEVMEARVLPALAGDGGGLEIVGFENYVLTIRYQGACGSCPSAITGTLRAIEQMLQNHVDPMIMVVAG